MGSTKGNGWNGFKLSRRLTAIAGMIPEGIRICDVGCDHAHVPIWLVKNHIVPSALAMDIIPGPLQKARENLELYGETDTVEIRESDGLDAYCPGECGTLVIAGMGGRIMERILLRERDKTSSFENLVLQPQADYERVRRSVRELGFAITREVFVLEDGKYYPVFCAQKGREQLHPCWNSVPIQSSQDMRQETEDLFGPILLKDRDPVLLQFLLWQREVGLRVLSSIGERDRSEDPAKTARREAVSEKVRHMDLALGYMYGSKNGNT